MSTPENKSPVVASGTSSATTTGGGGGGRTRTRQQLGKWKQLDMNNNKTTEKSILKGQGISQLGHQLTHHHQALRVMPSRASFALTLSKDLLLVLRYLPVGVLNRLNNFLPQNSQLSVPAASGGSSSMIENTNHPPLLQQQSTATLSGPIFADLYDRASVGVVYSSADNIFKRNWTSGTSPVSSSSSSKLPDKSSESSGGNVETSPPKLPPVVAPKAAAAVKKDKENPADWGLDPDLKPFLQDMATEWKNVQARTRYLVNKLASVVDEQNIQKIQYLEDLHRHLNQYRESRASAIECGAIRNLVKIIKNPASDPCLVNCARETLGVLGVNPPLKGHGIKVLSIDGGGIRGLVAIEVLRMIEQRTGQKVHELFDYICGVSTGSILAFLIGAHRRTLGECEALYKQLSQEIFNQNSLIGAGNLFWSHSYYNTAAWEKILKKHIGEDSLITLARDPDLPRVAAISTVVNQERVYPYVFRTYAFKPSARPRYTGCNRYEMWEAVRASAAAPTYFEEIRLGKNLHQDGGVLVNNPTSVALSEAKSLWEGQELQCVMSLGTGQTFSSRKNPNLSDLLDGPHQQSSSSSNPKSPNSLSWKGKFLKVLDSATDTESVHHTMTELLPPNVYFRFNPHLSEMITMDEARSLKLEQLQEETREYLTRNLDKVDYCCQMLTKPKGIVRKVSDWWRFYT